MKIKNIEAIKILDSRGEETVKIKIESSQGTASACVPQGKSTGSHEVKITSPEKAQEIIDKEIMSKIKDKEINTQEEIDKALLEIDHTKDKSMLGGNITLGISIAFSRIASRSQDKDLHKYLAELINETSETEINLLMNFINGGVHSPSGPSIQEYLLIIPFNQGQGLKKGVDLYKKLGQKLKTGTGDEGGYILKESSSEKPLEILKELLEENKETNIRLGIDAAASKIQEEINMEDLIKKYNLLYIEDPLPEDDWDGFINLKKQLNENNLIIGDDLTVTNPERIEKAGKEKIIDGVIIKPNQIGTIWETIQAIKKANQYNLKTIISHRSGETCDTFIADLAVAANAWGFKSGAPRGSERNGKYSRLLYLKNKK
ncbi:MAG: hypothetical protein GF387_00925 [Candidatus Portnoybacteria bacterium]|nr:hypothetical protein [Candidatus Portnoybacteria bacterium]